MTAREFLTKYCTNEEVTFIIQHAVKDEHSPFYNNTYSTTPMRRDWEWQRHIWLDSYIVIKADHPPIDVTGAWLNRYNAGHLKCAMLTTEADLIRHYGEKQGRDMIEWYKRTVK